MELTQTLTQMAEQARAASRELAGLSSDQKNKMLQAMADGLRQQQATILAANAKDVAAAREAGTSDALVDRLVLNEQRVEAMAQGFEQVIQLPDPVGVLMHQHETNNHLMINKVRVPIGVITVIYESRPNVTADVSALCLKTANAIILRGGSDAFHSNQAITRALLMGGQLAGLPQYALQCVDSTDRKAVEVLVSLDKHIDLVIPRGGENLINRVVELSKIPIIKHYKGLCHIYVDASANTDMALAICENAKCQRPGVCNAVETVLVHQDIAKTFLPQLAEKLQSEGVEVRGDDVSRDIYPSLVKAEEADWSTEYLDLVLAVKVVPDIQTAITHINDYGSHHSDAIIAAEQQAQQQFSDQVDSAAVYINASTRFTDGEQFGMGAEIGISTDKLHARGPMGLEELTTYKYVIQGTGQVRE